MDLEEYRTLFVVGTLVLILVVASPALSVVVPFRVGSERFSEIWLLGPGHALGDYPFNVTVGYPYSVFVGVGNHMGCSEYYVIYVKFRNWTQPLPDADGQMPSSLPPLYEFRFFVADGAIWESPLVFAFHNVSLQRDSMFVGNISINGETFSVNCSSTWDSENRVFYYQLFFELWRYDYGSSSLKYHGKIVGLMLNMTV
jgi:hypothetical protein